MWYFWPKKLMEIWYLLITESSCFELFVDGKYDLSLSQEVNGKIIIAGYREILVFNFSVIGNTVLFSAETLMQR